MSPDSPYRYALSTLLVALAVTVFPSTVAAQQVALPLQPALAQSKKTETASAPSGNATASDDKAQASQEPSSASTQPPSFHAGRQFPKDLLRDQKAIWTSPLRIERSDAKWLVPIAAATVVMITTDRRASGELGDSKDLVGVSRDISNIGLGTMIGAIGTIYVIGRLTQNDRAREAGLLGLVSLIHSNIVVGVLKLATNRERPDMHRGDGRFWAGGKSFPSGHAVQTWALAAVIAEEYRDKPLVRFGAYGLATAVSVSRFTGRKHSPSDVVVGGALGYLIGRYVVRRHAMPHSSNRSAMISPYLNRPTRTYGLAVSFQF